MTLKDWQARWGHHVPAQALAELVGILSPVMPSPALNARWKSSDLIGILPVLVQPSHVGQTLGVFLAVETKKPGWRLTPGDKRGQAQAAFLQSVRGFGGVGGFCCTADDFAKLLLDAVDNSG